MTRSTNPLIIIIIYRTVSCNLFCTTRKSRQSSISSFPCEPSVFVDVHLMPGSTMIVVLRNAVSDSLNVMSVAFDTLIHRITRPSMPPPPSGQNGAVSTATCYGRNDRSFGWQRWSQRVHHLSYSGVPSTSCLVEDVSRHL